MVESHWDDLRGNDVWYRDQTWELTGDLDIRERGELLAVTARATGDAAHKGATLVFDIVGERGSPSINPGNLGAHFNRIERTDDDHFLVVKTDQRTYRYKLHRLEQG